MKKAEDVRTNWRAQGEDVISGMLEWRLQHPKATFREIEAEVDQRLAEMRVKMLADAALMSQSADWEEEGGKCPQCGEALEKKGKKKRKMQTRGGKEVEIERENGLCPKCGQSFFPSG